MPRSRAASEGQGTASEHAAEPADALADLGDDGAAVAEDQAWLGGGAEIAGGERHDPEALPRGLGGEPLIVHPGTQSRRQVHAGPPVADPQLAAELAVEGLDQGVPPFAVELAHLAQMADEVALVDEVREDGLVEGRREAVR